jgi:molybdopterin-guanine dinucleotide biosynthesis protein A
MSTAITGVILAGGKSSRMGTDKGLLKLDSRPFVAHISATLQAAFDRVFLVADDTSTYGFLGLETIGDVYRGCGPLGGIHSALVHADGADIFVSACDTPFITRELVQYIVEFPSGAAARIPSHNQQLHPLCGFYSQRCLQSVSEQLEAGRYRVLDFVDKIGATVIPISPDLPFYREDLFSNINTPEDYPRNENLL